MQDELRKEIFNVIGEENQPSWSDRSEMPYTEATIMEIQRISSALFGEYLSTLYDLITVFIGYCDYLVEIARAGLGFGPPGQFPWSEPGPVIFQALWVMGFQAFWAFRAFWGLEVGTIIAAIIIMQGITELYPSRIVALIDMTFPSKIKFLIC